MIAPLFSTEVPQIDWGERHLYISDYGNKAAGLLVIPRKWTLPFILFPRSFFQPSKKKSNPFHSIKSDLRVKLIEFLKANPVVIIRSSIVNESIWESGTYRSEKIHLDKISPSLNDLWEYTKLVLQSAKNRKATIILQSYMAADAKGKLGNLLRISKTINQWEVNFEVSDTFSNSTQRINSQRDRAANPSEPLERNYSYTHLSSFRRIGAWINGELLSSSQCRVNCEWVYAKGRLYLVQITEEDEDADGYNPLQMNVNPLQTISRSKSKYLRMANDKGKRDWDKLHILDILWDEKDLHKPLLFYIPLKSLGKDKFLPDKKELKNDFAEMFGEQSNIVIRTSARTGYSQETNLPRTECVDPENAVKWVYQEWDKHKKNNDLEKFAFIFHHFIPSRSSAWVNVDQARNIIEIHALWGLPDGLQYFPHDYVDVYTGATQIKSVITPQYKTSMLIRENSGKWDEKRINNFIARSQSISKEEAQNIAIRSSKIASRMGADCNIMWFIGCETESGESFNSPWYCIKAEKHEPNKDRLRHKRELVRNGEELKRLRSRDNKFQNIAIELRPNLNLMRDNDFIDEVGEFAKDNDIPIYFTGSTLAHAYYRLIKKKAKVIHEHLPRKRIRELEVYSKIVRDGIPAKIESQRENVNSFTVDPVTSKKFLVAKLLEEALEFRNAKKEEDKVTELADIYEVFRALAKLEKLPLRNIEGVAKLKRERSGGFEKNRILQTTSLPFKGELSLPLFEFSKKIQMTTPLQASGEFHESSDVFPSSNENSIEIPFSSFGFLELEKGYDIHIPESNVTMRVILNSDKLKIEILEDPQFSFGFDE